MIRLYPIVLVILAASAAAGDKPKLQVVFELTEPDYLSEFTVAETRQIEGSAGAALLAQLQRQFKFVDFQLATGADHTLVVRLHRAGASEEVGFHVNLADDLEVDDPVYATFRSATAAADPVGALDPFAREVELSLATVDYEDVGKRLLRQIPIPAAGTELIKTPWLGWKIPFTLQELCMDRDSLLVLDNTLPVGGFEVSERFEATSALVSSSVETRTAPLAGPIYTRIRPGQAMIEELRSADPSQVAIQFIYVIEYQLFNERDACEQLVSPTDIDFEGGS